MNINDLTKCPRCVNTYHTKDAHPAFADKLHKVHLLYAFCRECKYDYDAADEHQKKSIHRDCFLNIELGYYDASGKIYPYSYTNEITLHKNGYNLERALLDRQSLTKEIYKQVKPWIPNPQNQLPMHRQFLELDFMDE